MPLRFPDASCVVLRSRSALPDRHTMQLTLLRKRLVCRYDPYEPECQEAEFAYRFVVKKAASGGCTKA